MSITIDLTDDELKTIAGQQGQSLNAFVLSAIDEKIERIEREV